jgi:hypothetical protein
MKTLLLLLIPFVAFSQTVEVRTPAQLSDAISNKYTARLMNDIDLTGVMLPVVESKINGSGKKVLYKKLPVTGEVFLFYVNGGWIDSLTITGPNGNVMAEGGYFGAVRVTEMGGKITNTNFINCDKFGIYNNGIRTSEDDSCYIANCTFTGNNRNGYGYGIWTQYGRSVVRNCVFQQCRHFFDCSSEAWSYDIQYCTFTASHWNYGLHNHEYPNGSLISGKGMVFKNNYVFGTTVPFEGYRSSGATIMQSNFFEASSIGNLSGVPIQSDTTVFKLNKIGGEGMLPAPIITATESVRVGQPIAFSTSGYKKLFTEDGRPPASFPAPFVKTYSCYGVVGTVRSITAYKAISVTDTGKYSGLYIKTFKSKVEVYKSGVKIATISSPVWKMYLYRGDIRFKIISEVGGECLVDDWVKSGASETFESTSKVKVSGYSTPKISVGRFTGDKMSGLWSLRFLFSDGGGIWLE